MGILRAPVSGDAALTVLGDMQASGYTGWNFANETWTYASATTFTVPTDLTAKYQKGTKLKLTQTTAKYFYVTASSYGAPNTTVTVMGGSDYSLANAAITLPSFSYIEYPQAFPVWFTWAPTYSGNGSLTYTSVSTNIARFSISGTRATVVVKSNGTTGGTTNTTLYATAPVEAAQSANSPAGTAYVSDAGGNSVVGFSFISAGTPDLLSFRKYDSSNWTLGAGSVCSGIFTYEI